MTTAIRSLILLISCPDRKGIVAAVTRFISEHNGNILHLDQHVDTEENVFFMRVEFEEQGFAIPADRLTEEFRPIADEFRMQWVLRRSDAVPRMALFVSKESHCLFDVLSRVQAGEWQVEVPLVIGNHEDLAPVAARFGVRFEAYPITKENREEQERAELRRLEEERIDFVVLARYMQIVSPAFVGRFPNRVINIHHSFLPAFPGARPYHSAYARGVKIIGATSHYVTSELDMGPIIEQDIVRVTHRDSLDDFIRKGKDLEKIVLSRAIWWHLQHRVLVYSNKTVIFD